MSTSSDEWRCRLPATRRRALAQAAAQWRVAVPSGIHVIDATSLGSGEPLRMQFMSHAYQRLNVCE